MWTDGRAEVFDSRLSVADVPAGSSPQFVYAENGAAAP